MAGTTRLELATSAVTDPRRQTWGFIGMVGRILFNELFNAPLCSGSRAEQRASSTLPRNLLASPLFVLSLPYRHCLTAERLAICLERTVFLRPFLKQRRIVMKL